MCPQGGIHQKCAAVLLVGALALLHNSVSAAEASQQTLTEPELVVLRLRGAGLEPAVLRSLQVQLEESAGDLGLTVDLLVQPTDPGAAGLLRQARDLGRWLVLGQLEVDPQDANQFVLDLRLARPDNKVLLSATRSAPAEQLAVKAAVMLRDLVAQARGATSVAPPALVAAPVYQRSGGRSILAANGALYGAFVGYSLQRASESDDPRLLYPLLAVGAGVGLGAAVIISEEWDVSPGDAWYLAAGTWWPAVAGHLLYEGRFGDTKSASVDEPWAFGLVGSVAGVTVASGGLVAGSVGDGGAVLAHSGGTLGLVVGGLTEFAISGESDGIPFAGMGYGAAGGWLVSSAAATVIHPTSSQLLAVDLGLMLGALGGASAASPLLFDEPSHDKTRIWAAASAAGLLGGGAVAWVLSEPPAGDDVAAAWWRPFGVLHPGAVGLAPGLGEVTQPGIGAVWRGALGADMAPTDVSH